MERGVWPGKKRSGSPDLVGVATARAVCSGRFINPLREPWFPAIRQGLWKPRPGHPPPGRGFSFGATNESYVGRILRLTLLAPDIVEAILSGRALKAQRKELRRLLGGRLRFDY